MRIYSFLLLLLSFFTFSLNAQDIDNFTQSDNGGMLIDGTLAAAQAFVPDNNYVALTVRLNVDEVSAGNFSVAIYNDVAGNPGTLIGTLSGTTSPSGDDLYTGNATLTSGMTYYIVPRASSGVFDINTTNSSTIGGTWSAPYNYQTGVAIGGIPTTWSATVSNQRFLFSITGSMALLPVKLASFSAQPQTESVLLHWETKEEINNDYFEILHSTDGENWELIGKVVGKGTTYEKQSYHFEHTNFNYGLNYYRLYQVDFDGNYEFSDVVNAMIEIKPTKIKAQVFPNPTVDFLNIRTETPIVAMRVYNQMGQVVKEYQPASKTNLETMKVSNLSSGYYVMEIFREEGKVEKQVFLKQ